MFNLSYLVATPVLPYQVWYRFASSIDMVPCVHIILSHPAAAPSAFEAYRYSFVCNLGYFQSGSLYVTFICRFSSKTCGGTSMSRTTGRGFRRNSFLPPPCNTCGVVAMFPPVALAGLSSVFIRTAAFSWLQAHLHPTKPCSTLNHDTDP